MKSIILILIILANVNCMTITNSIRVSQPSLMIKKFKFMFLLKWPSIRSDLLHPMNTLTYKNVLLSNDQIVYFVSKNVNDPTPDETWDTSHYLFTMKYEYLDLPCINRSFICTHNQFVKEFRPIYPEINYEIPKEVLNHFIEPSKASSNCLIITINAVLSLSEAAWLCHDDLKQIYTFQDKLSQLIRDANDREYDMVLSYINNKSTLTPGILTIGRENLKFTSLLGKRNMLSLTYNNIIPYALSLYLKENLKWEGDDAKKPEETRCLRFQRKDDEMKDKPDYFCVFFGRNDVFMKTPINLVQARYLADMYSNKINTRLQNIALNESLRQISSMKELDLELNTDLLNPIKTQIRNEYYIQKHRFTINLKLNRINKTEYEENLKSSKEKIINSVCGNSEVCKKAMQYSKDRGLLPLNGSRERFALDMQNPFNSLVPKTSLKIKLPIGGEIGKKLLEEVQNLTNSKLESEFIPESAPGEIPNSTSIKRAFNTILSLREKRIYMKFEELGQSCRINKRSNLNDLKRKVAILEYVGYNDSFFEYLGDIRNEQVLRSRN